MESSMSNKSSKSSINSIQKQNEETITPKETVAEDKFTLTDYDSDRTNSIVDDDYEI